MIIRMIWPPPCSSLPLQMVICKEDDSPDDQKQGDEGAGIVANDHPDDPVSSISLQMVTCKEDCPPNDQNQRNGEAWIVANDHLDDLASSVLFCSFANKRFALFTRSSFSVDPNYFIQPASHLCPLNCTLSLDHRVLTGQVLQRPTFGLMPQHR